MSELTRVGRPAIEITDSHISAIEAHAGKGFTLHQIALMIDVSDSTLDRWMKEPKVKRAYERGKLIATDSMASRLWTIAHQDEDMKSAVVAAIFWLKAQAGWIDKPIVTAETVGSQVVFYIPENQRSAAVRVELPSLFKLQTYLPV